MTDSSLALFEDSGGLDTRARAPLATQLQPLQALRLHYKFAMDEVLTKVRILDEELGFRLAHSPIEHVTSRLKSIESLTAKAHRKSVPLTVDALRSSILDIAGVRIVCSFTADVYDLLQLLSAQDDLVVRNVKDYISDPKPNGYRSLHALVEVPVFLSTGAVLVPVEVQLRTIAMDFWASLEHKIHYKYEGSVPDELKLGLMESARTAAHLDREMENLHERMLEHRSSEPHR